MRELPRSFTALTSRASTEPPEDLVVTECPCTAATGPTHPPMFESRDIAGATDLLYFAAREL